MSSVTAWRRLSVGRRGLITIAGGTVIGQVLALMAAPLLTRVFTPSDFGILTIVSALALSLASVAALRLALAVPLPSSEREAHSLVFLGLICTIMTAVLGTMVVAIAGDWVARLFNDSTLRPWLWAVPALASTMAAYAVLNQLALRHQQYGTVGRRNVVSSLVTMSTQLVTGTAGLAGGLVVGLAAGQLVGAVSLLPGSGLRQARIDGSASLDALRSVLVRYRRFPLMLAPAGLLNVLGLQLPLLLIAYFYGSAVAGWLGVTQRVLAIPLMLVGQTVAQVYLGELSRQVRSERGDSRALFRRVSLYLTGLALVGAVALTLFAPFVFRVVFGAQWTTSGDYARALAFGLAAQMVAAPLSQTLIVLGHHGGQLAWDAARLTLTAGVVILSAALGYSPIVAIWGLGAALALSYAAGWWMAHRAINRYARVGDPR